MAAEDTTDEPKGKSPVEIKSPTMKEDTDEELGELEDVVLKKAGIAQSSGKNDSDARGTSKMLLAPSTSTPGAFAIDNPLRDESAQSTTGDSQSMALIAQSSSTGAVTTTSLTTAEPVASLTTAEPVSIAVAEPSKSVGNKSSLGDRNKRKKTTLFVAAIAVIAILAIVVGVVFYGPTPTSPRRNDMIDFLSRITPVEAFESNGSRYNADRINALRWIVEDDPMQLPIPTDDVPNSDPVAWALLQRYSLAVLYFATSGYQWVNNFLFLSEYDVCRWSTIGVSDEFWNGEERRDYRVKGVSCDGDDRVNMIRLYWNNLSGTIPDELGLFSDTMTQLLLTGNSISGNIPDFLEKFSLLENLALSDNCLTGALPQGVIELPSLEYFALYNNNNQITGSAEEYCASTSTASSPAYREGTLGIFLDSEIECSCCTSCRPNEFECDNPIYNVTYPTLNIESPQDARDSKGNTLQFQKDCITPEELEWVAENCPCVVPLDDEDSGTYTDTFFAAECSDCAAPNALPSTGRD